MPNKLLSPQALLDATYRMDSIINAGDTQIDTHSQITPAFAKALG